ncbi:hypothetical protein [Corynebacterium qintianiae]|uniref:hypothetical protein n=1 Tax=Corynebacterium qintianiae TaxID=2709392 RepID=UPI0013EB2239|nr:hypothetical protein [Corynebacterium qintianiae]
MASVFKTSVQQEIHDQPIWLRYKGSLIIVATGIVSIVAQLATSPDFAGTQTATILTIIATSAGFLLNRFTRDGVTPSMASRLEDAAQRVFDTIPFLTQPATDFVEVRRPVETPAAQAYVGEHRAEDDGLADGEAARAHVERVYRAQQEG